MASERSRACDVCGGSDVERLHTQPFLLPGDRLTRYDVVACRTCGFAFSTNIPSREDYEAYYRANLRYTYEGSRNVSEGLVAIHRDSFEFVHGLLGRRDGVPATAQRVLDVGCSTGHLLSFFRRAGYERLLGLDPAPECRALAERLYKVDVVTGSLSSFCAETPFDVVLLSSVLEHLPDPRAALDRVASLVAKDGLVFVQVPDAARFGVEMREPFLEFSIEHINYFTRESLEELMVRAGFVAVEVRPDVLRYNGTAYPALTSAWRRGASPAATPSRSDIGPLRAYVTRSSELLTQVDRALRPLAESREEVVVWGAGSLAARLLATTVMGELNIVGVVDSNPSLHTQRLLGLPIAPPASLRGGRVTVLVASVVWGEAIVKTLEEFGYEGRVVSL
jgi:SAM-dependent methyltransferase